MHTIDEGDERGAELVPAKQDTKAPAVAGAPVDPERKGRFDDLHKVVIRAAKSFVRGAIALAMVKQGDLWKEGGYASWQEYLAEVQGISRSYGQRIIEGGETALLLPENDRPDNEAQLRALTAVRKELGDEAVPQAWKSAKADARRSGKKVTAKIISQHGRAMMGNRRARDNARVRKAQVESGVDYEKAQPLDGYLANEMLSDLVPEMGDETYARLKQSIKDNGVREPISLWKDRIVDGRARYRACVELGIRPRVRRVTLEEAELLDFIEDANFNRRHLRPDELPQDVIEGEAIESNDPEPDDVLGLVDEPVEPAPTETPDNEPPSMTDLLD